MSQVLYKITPAFSAGEDGRKVLVIGGEYIGKPYDKGHRGGCFECELDKLEKNEIIPGSQVSSRSPGLVQVRAIFSAVEG